MTEEELMDLLKTRTVREKIVVHNNVQKSLYRIFCKNFIYDHRSCHFCRARDSRVSYVKYERTYDGETLMEVIEDVEANCPLELSIIPNCVGGFDFKMEYKEDD